MIEISQSMFEIVFSGYNKLRCKLKVNYLEALKGLGFYTYSIVPRETS